MKPVAWSTSRMLINLFFRWFRVSECKLPTSMAFGGREKEGWGFNETMSCGLSTLPFATCPFDKCLCLCG